MKTDTSKIFFYYMTCAYQIIILRTVLKIRNVHSQNNTYTTIHNKMTRLWKTRNYPWKKQSTAYEI